MTNEELVTMIKQGSDKRRYLEMLYQQNRNLIAKICGRYTAYDDFDDLMQEGFFGLCDAVEAWDSSRGAKFSTYAQYHIRASVQRYIENFSNVVRLPSHMRADIMKLKKITDSYYKTHGKKPTTQELAKIMMLPEYKIMEIIDSGLLLSPKSTNEIITEDDSLTLEDTLQDPHNNIDMYEESLQRQQLRATLWGIVDSLDSDQARLIREKYQHNVDAKTLADIMGMTPSKLKNTESKAMRELRKAHNRKRLSAFYETNSRIYSISLNYSSLGYFMNNWTSAPEKAVLMAESRV